MAPRIDGNNPNQIRPDEPTEREKIERNPPPPVPVVNPTPFFTMQAEFNFYGTRQRDRVERFFGAGSSALSSFNDIRLANATRDANWAYARTYRNELNALANPALSIDAPKNLVEVANRAELAYRAELNRAGFTPFDVRGTSALKAVDFLNLEAARGRNFETLSPLQIQNRLLSGEPPTYFVRVVESKYLTSTAATFSKPGQPNVWVATAEEIAGARLDGFEVMKRVGFDDNYISQLAASGKKPSDFTLVIVESRGTNGTVVPTWDRILDLTQTRINTTTNPDLMKFRGRDNSFWEGVRNLDYRTHLDNMERLGLKAADYANRLPLAAEAETFLARYQIEQNFGVNKFFTADGRTARTDGLNSGYGVREFLIDNNPVAGQQRQAFIQLQDTGITDLDVTNRVPTIAENPLRLRSEVRNGALIGGGISAVTSLPQIFEQVNNGDYTGAGATLVTNTALGTTVGGASSFGERIIGNRITNSLGNSTFAQNSLERLYTNGAARNVVSRFAGTESSALTSQTFNSTARTIAGRVGGAGIVGGIVNGGFAAYDQIQAYQRGEVTASQAIGTVVGEAGVGVAAGMAGAAAGAAIGSIIPGAGTIVGGVIGFAAGVVVGVAVDWGLRQLGADKAVAQFVTGAIDAGAELVGDVQEFGREAAETVSSAFNSATETVGNAVNDVGNAISGGLKSIFG